MSTKLEATITLVNSKMHYIGNTPTHGPIDFDYVPPYGDSEGVMPLEMFLMDLAVCSASSIKLVLEQMKKTINGLEGKAVGNRRDEHPTCFDAIAIEYTIHSPDADSASVDRAIALSKEKLCPVWAMINPNVKIETHYTIVP